MQHEAEISKSQEIRDKMLMAPSAKELEEYEKLYEATQDEEMLLDENELGQIVSPVPKKKAP